METGHGEKVFGKLSMLSRVPELCLHRVLGETLLDRMQVFLRLQRLQNNDNRDRRLYPHS